MESPAFSLQFALRECATSILLLGNVRTRLVEPLDTGYVLVMTSWSSRVQITSKVLMYFAGRASM